MASEIKVDTIVNAGGDNDTGIDLATNDQILLKVANSTKLTMNATGQTTIVGEGGTTTTSVQQGLCKAWVQGSDSAGRNDSLNIASGTDNGTGDYSYGLTNNFGNTAYSPAHIGLNASAYVGTCTGTDANTFRVKHFNLSDEARDTSHGVQCVGDLA